ncbi:hypothetical protein ACIBCD_05195 [Nocardia brasiliensis]|uniref:hypothetical protein n=1 Tax=Nocardia brasiliensis TaxID=37326 RepID=UPI0037941646
MVDLEIVGQDAESAARAFDRQIGRMLYDIPAHAIQQFRGSFDEMCRRDRLDASLRAFDRQVPHRQRVHRAITAGDSGFIISGVPVVTVGGVPIVRPLPVVAKAANDCWEYLRIIFSDSAVASVRRLGSVGIDHARFAFADAAALDAWEHELSIDGLADVVFWGLHRDEIADEFESPRTGVPGDDTYGWRDIPVAEAYAKAVALHERRNRAPERRFAVDFRPHSHHWQVMAGVRAAEHEAATVDVGGARILFAMTSVGDGFFPVQLELDDHGAPVGLRISIQDCE